MNTMTPQSLKSLETGDFVPPFCLPDQTGTEREIHLYAGRHVALVFLPVANESFLAAFLGSVAARENEISAADFGMVKILAAGTDALKAIESRYDTSRLGLTKLYWSDESQSVYRAFGIEDKALTHGFGFLLSHNQKIIARFTCEDGAELLGQIINFFKQRGKPHPRALEPSAIHAPAMIIPDALSPELCDTLLAYWQQGKKYQGSIGADGNEKVVLSGKRRVDSDIHDRSLLTRIDEAMCKRVFPELRKVAGVEIAYREIYKVGGYSAQDQGYYHQHRDTAPQLSYRRYSMSLMLSDDYEGGYLQFPEYDFCAYKLVKRSAIVFPSTLLHGVTPVTKGQRHVLVSFFYTEAERARRLLANEKFDEGALRLLCSRHFEGIAYSQFFYSNSLDPNA